MSVIQGMAAPAGAAAAEASGRGLPEGAPVGLYARGGKRLMDLALVLAAAPFVLPVVALLAVLAALDGGPAFYGQTRLGRGGRLFTCWKIRTMAVDAEARLDALLAADPAASREWAEKQKLTDDPRITRVGRWLRRTSLDELPQLWNVVEGEMSLVGPRPMMPEQEPLYPAPAVYRALRPGLTCFWQVGARNGSPFADRARQDARYLREFGVLTDLRLLAMTAPAVLASRGL